MKIFTSWIRGVITGLLIKHLLLGAFIFFFFWLIELKFDIGSQQLASILLFYVIALYVYIGLTNHDFIVYADKISIINRIPGFRRKVEIALPDIEKIDFKDDLTSTVYNQFTNYPVFGIIIYFLSIIIFPSEYKWIEISTKSKRRERYYCFGLEFDCNGDNVYKPTIDDFYAYLHTIGLLIQWR